MGASLSKFNKWVFEPTAALHRMQLGPESFDNPLMVWRNPAMCRYSRSQVVSFPQLQFFTWEARHNNLSWWGHLESEVPQLAKMGFTQIWLPPPNKAAENVRNPFLSWGTASQRVIIGWTRVWCLWLSMFLVMSRFCIHIETLSSGISVSSSRKRWLKPGGVLKRNLFRRVTLQRTLVSIYLSMQCWMYVSLTSILKFILRCNWSIRLEPTDSSVSQLSPLTNKTGSEMSAQRERLRFVVSL